MPAFTRRLMNGWTDLHEAAATGDLARLRHAVQKSPSDIDKINRDRQTPLHVAAEKGFDPVLGELLDRQAKTTLQDGEGRTPLHIAAMAGHAGCVALLLGHRNRELPVEKERLLGLRDREGRDALMAAVQTGKTDTVEALLRNGADAARCMDQSGCGVLIVAVTHDQVHLLPLLAPACGLEQRDPASGGTALHVAAKKGSLQAVDWLLRAGASTCTRDNKGQTAAEAAHAVGQTAAYRMLRDAAAGMATQAGGGGGRGGSAGRAQLCASSCHDLYAPPGGLGPVAAGASAIPGQQPGADPDGPPASRLVIPEQLPNPVYYPKTPDGASVYY